MKQLSFFLFALLLFAACGETAGTAEEAATDTTAVEEEPMVEETTGPGDIVALASETENLSTLVAAVQAAGLVETLQGDGPFTVFAPTDEAFAALPEGTLENLLKPENKGELTAILTYHVLGSKVMSTDLSDGMSAPTVNGANVNVSITDGTVMINNATVSAADVEASNGVVHIVDTVILPPTDN